MSQWYSSSTAGAARGFTASTSWRFEAIKSLRMEQREAKVLSMAIRSEREVDSRAMVMW